MKLHFTPVQVAQHAGKLVEQCLTDATLAMLQECGVFLAAIEEGIAAADRGELIEDEEVQRWLEERERS